MRCLQVTVEGLRERVVDDLRARKQTVEDEVRLSQVPLIIHCFIV